MSSPWSEGMPSVSVLGLLLPGGIGLVLNVVHLATVSRSGGRRLRAGYFPSCKRQQQIVAKFSTFKWVSVGCVGCLKAGWKKALGCGWLWLWETPAPSTASLVLGCLWLLFPTAVGPPLAGAWAAGISSPKKPAADRFGGASRHGTLRRSLWLTAAWPA